MDTLRDFVAASILSVLVLGCAQAPPSAPPPHADVEEPANVQGHWHGTFFQKNVDRAYPMDLAAEGNEPGRFAVTLTWPQLSNSQTVGQGNAHGTRISWSEDKLVRGKDVLLHGEYTALLLDPDTLVGVYNYDDRQAGSFSLSRQVEVPKTADGTTIFAAPGGKQKLAVLYAGCPGTDREKDFLAFLRTYFDRVETTGLQSLSMKVAQPFDVVVADWKPRYAKVEGKTRFDSSAGHNFSLPRDFSKPVIMIGAVGGEVARWSKIGWL